ncbi:MAG: T9SS type A sorting domain-containing protein, partial [Bacteroidetes bacterium]|nr:T9SS type A sorting domain-containing protein [Bacteroidota bacterium]
LTQAERDSIAAWRDRNNPWAGKPTVGRYVSAAGSEVTLSAVVPNPFREFTTINYALPVGAPVRIAVYDSRGAFVATLEAGEQSAGQYAIRWDGTDEQGYRVAAGTYVLQLTTPDATRVQKMEVVR